LIIIIDVFNDESGELAREQDGASEFRTFGGWSEFVVTTSYGASISHHFTIITITAASVLNMEKTIGAQLTALFQSGSNGRRLSAADGQIVDAATNFLSSAVESLADMRSAAIDKLEGRSGDDLSRALNVFSKEVMTENSWGDLGNGDLLAALKDAQSIAEAELLWEEAENKTCTPLEYTLPAKEPTKCEGPSIKLVYKPKECIVEEHMKEIDCKPAKLVLEKVPGKCVFKHHTPFTFKDKECKGETKFAWHNTTTYGKGGEDYTLFIDQHNITLPSYFH